MGGDGAGKGRRKGEGSAGEKGDKDLAGFGCGGGKGRTEVGGNELEDVGSETWAGVMDDEVKR